MVTFGIVFLLLVFFLSALYVYFKRKFSYWKERNVPHKKPTFFFGNLLELIFYKGITANYFANLYNEFNSPYIGFYGLTTPYLLLKDSNLIKTVFIKDFNVFPNRCYLADEKIDPMLSNSLLAIENPQWKVLRKILSPVFSSGKIKLMMPLMVECGKNLANYISSKSNQNLEMKEIAAQYTTDLIYSCVFGLNANSFVKGNEFRHYGKLLFSPYYLRAFRFTTYIFAPMIVKIFRYSFLNKTATDYFCKVFENTLNSRKPNKSHRNDLIDILNEIKSEENTCNEFKLEGDRIFAQALVFFTAGHETTSATISFTLHELSVNSNIQQKLREEVLNKIEKYGGVTYEAIQEMKYLDMVVLETLRKYPLLPVLHRRAIQDYEFVETGLKIKKGTGVVVSLKALHWDPCYFPQPENYDPERFNEANKCNTLNSVYMPFGDGPRSCIGERFGMLSTKIGIIYVIKYFQVEMNSETRHPVVFGSSSILRSKHGIPLTCTKLK